MPRMPWSHVPPTVETLRHPPREYGILPFWFLNGELDPDEMRWQLRELREKGMPGDHPPRPLRPGAAVPRSESSGSGSASRSRRASGSG